jgi:uncharacterized membrane protein YhaH (DUF805 family)
MTASIESVRNGFTGLARFSGRDPARRFWPYAGVVVGGLMALMMAAIIPVMNRTFAGMATLPASGSSALMPDMTPFFTVIQIGVVANIVLLAAAVVRRLHDRGRGGWWGLPPAVFASVAMTLFPHLFQSFSQGTATPAMLKLFGLLFANNALYLASLVLLIVMLAGASQPGENRFGPPAP